MHTLYTKFNNMFSYSTLCNRDGPNPEAKDSNPNPNPNPLKFPMDSNPDSNPSAKDSNQDSRIHREYTCT